MASSPMLMAANKHSPTIKADDAQKQRQLEQKMLPSTSLSSTTQSQSNTCNHHLTSNANNHKDDDKFKTKTTTPSSSSSSSNNPLLPTASTSFSGSSGETVIEIQAANMATNGHNDIASATDNSEHGYFAPGDAGTEADNKRTKLEINHQNRHHNHHQHHHHHHGARHQNRHNQNLHADRQSNESTRSKNSESNSNDEGWSSMSSTQVQGLKCDVGIQVDDVAECDDDKCAAASPTNGSTTLTATPIQAKRHNKFPTNLIKSINRLNPFLANNNGICNNGKHTIKNNSNTNNFDDQHQQQQHQSVAWYQAFAQRYLRRKSHSSSQGSNDLMKQTTDGNTIATNSLQAQLTTHSAPVTPVKWVEARNNYEQLGALPEAQLETELTLESQRAKTNSSFDVRIESNQAGSESFRSNQSGSRPSVRFADETRPSHDDQADHDECDELAELDEDGLDDEVGGALEDDDFGSKKASEIVAKLFQFPTPPGANVVSGGNNPTVLIENHQENKSQSHDQAAEGAGAAPLEEGECPMDSGHFRHYGYRLIDYVCNYLDTIKERRVTPLNIEPGYLKSLIEPAAPEKGEPFPKIMQDFEKHIMCGITHWQHPHFHAYFPAGNAYPSILADMLSDALGCMGFSWAASPAYTELEIIMLDWMGKMIGLPDEFLCLSGSQESRGGGVIQGSASECVLVNLLAARHWAIERLRSKYPRLADGMLLSKLIGYCSKEAHSCVEKAAMIGFIRMRALDTDENQSLRGETLAKAIEADLEQGLEPFLVCATLGTTSCVSFDNLHELGIVCEKHDIWLHVDAAYAGSALICPEFKYLMRGIEKASSFNMNPNKWMLINFDCSLMWVKDRFMLTRAFVVDPLYLQHSYSDQAIDYRHWGIPLSRRFRALKLWFVIRNYGISGLQAYVRNHVNLAKFFEKLIKNDTRFTVTNQVVLGLVCFRLIGSNALNQRLLSLINASGKLHMVPASVNGRYVIRFCICDQNAKEEDVRYAYDCIADFATELIASVRAGKERFRAISAQNTVEMLASALPIGVQSPDESGDNNNNNKSPDGSRAADGNNEVDATLSKNCAINARPGSRLSQRSISMDSSSRQLTPSIETTGAADDSSSPRFDPCRINADCQPSNQTTPVSPHSRPDSRLGVSGANLPAGTSKGPLTKQRSILASDTNGELDEFLENPQRGKSAAGDTTDVGALTTSEQQQQQPDSEQFKTAQRRARVTSGRYKRKFFVRVVSDPRVYRASISGDINAHSSSGSLAGNGSFVSNSSQQSFSGESHPPNQHISSSSVIPKTKLITQQKLQIDHPLDN